jgi:1,4-dihydroxy-2-naphthoyl-CoA hydrolase
MKSIWFKNDVDLEELQSLSSGTMAEHLEMKWEEAGNDYLRMSMPVTSKVKQPFGILHGGASCALAETIGSVASNLVLDPLTQMAVGMEINANHVRSAEHGIVYAIAKPLHIGRTSHVWDIRISNDKNQLICVSRLTVAILAR